MPAQTVLAWARGERVFPGAVAEVGTSRHVVWRHAAGALTYDADAVPAAADTVYDLASLTKVIATASVAMRLTESGSLDLDEPVARRAASWDAADRSCVTARDLLEHTSGLPGWLPLFRVARGRAAFVAEICRTPLAFAPRSQSVYSDLGFILLGALLEEIGNSSLDVLATAALSDVGGEAASELAFGVPPGCRGAVAPTRVEDERGRLAPGAVDDTNAWALGGVAGHAGMFGTAAGVGAFARAVLAGVRGEASGPGAVAAPATVAHFTARSTVPGSSRALAWDTMLPTSSCGTLMSGAAFGHTGFTGTSLWIDPRADLYVVLLSNRVHPRDDGADGIQAVRRAFHNAVMESMAR